jgi:flap endonuclease-1
LFTNVFQDTLAFGAPVLLQDIVNGDQVTEINLSMALSGLDLSREQFIDLCILLGCDYCPKIKGIGPVKAIKYISSFKTIENICENCSEFVIPGK